MVAADPMLIRDVEPGDTPILSALARKTYAEAFGHSLTAADLALQLEETRSESYFRSVIGRDTILVALVGDTIVGYVQICDVMTPIVAATAKDQQINALYVHPDYQGRGIGKSLLNTALKHPRLRRGENVYLDVWDRNVRAMRLYERCGFEIAGRSDVVIGSRVIGQDLIMVRRSSPPVEAHG